LPRFQHRRRSIIVVTVDGGVDRTIMPTWRISIVIRHVALTRCPLHVTQRTVLLVWQLRILKPCILITGESVISVIGRFLSLRLAIVSFDQQVTFVKDTLDGQESVQQLFIT
jgi:hypothetical protein